MKGKNLWIATENTVALENNFYRDNKLSQIFSTGDSPITLFTNYSGLSYYLFIFVVKCGAVKLIKAEEWGLASYAFLFLKTILLPQFSFFILCCTN